MPDYFNTNDFTGIITNGDVEITNYVQMNGLVGQIQLVTNWLNISTYPTNIAAVSNHSWRVVMSFNILDSYDKVLEVPVLVTNIAVGTPLNPPPANQIIYPFGSTPFLSLQFVDTNGGLNLLGIGWLERKWSQGTNLYDTTSQDLIKYSQAHDTLFGENNGNIVVGGYAFAVPPNAVPAQSVYEIRIGRPSATSDGVGAPGSDVYIATPTNGSLGYGSHQCLETRDHWPTQIYRW